MNPLRLLGATSLVSAICCGPAGAQTAGPVRLAELADLELEQLTKITVMSAARREESLADTPASLYVITRDDIRRSGANTIPEILRLAPNLHVARADAAQYAISARGFNNTLANKLLVLMDGRTLYTPLFSGVFWEGVEAFIPDIERIEVISGPGATLWGANAVNGVINIITSRAKDAQGTLVYAGGGNEDREAGLRYGGELPSGGAYRAWVKYYGRDGARTDTHVEIGDDVERVAAGARADWTSATQTFTLQLNAYQGDIDSAQARDFSGASLRGRWSRDLGAGSNFTAQTYFEHSYRKHQSSFEESLDMWDIDVQHTLNPMPGHMVVWGGGYRHARDDVTNSPSQAFMPPDRTLDWANLFVQDEIALSPTLALTLGLKAERNPYTGTEWLPNARLAWKVRHDSLLWASVSRAVRAPSRIDREVFFPGNPPYALVANDTFEAEAANVAELGYRTQASETVTFSATYFYQDYPNLRSVGPSGTGSLQFRNDIEGRVTGLETWAGWRVHPTWRLTAGLVLQDVDTRVKAGQLDFGGKPLLGNDPGTIAQLRSAWSPTARHDFDVFLRHVSKLETVVPAYTAVDMRFAWRPMPALELSLVVRNAFDGEHIEWQNRGLVERSWYAGFSWRP
jgi:iron complex outermembrane receptor protein